MNKSRGDFLVSQIKQLHDRTFDKMLKESGIGDLNGAQGRILFVLWQEDNLSISELARRTSLANTTLTSMVDRLVDREYIKRVFDQNDKRQIRLVLTEKAKALSIRYEEVYSKMNELFYNGFSKDESSQLDELLEKVMNNLKTIK